MVNVSINGKDYEVESGLTILQVARKLGITIPTLCDHPDLTPYGGCRLCVVDVKGFGRPVASCTQPVSKGMVIRTETGAIVKSRKAILRMLLSNYHDAGYSTPGEAQSEFMHWVEFYGIKPRRASLPKPRAAINSDPNPVVWVDMNKCITCTRCIRACAEIQGRFVWTLAQRGFESRVVAGNDLPMLEARCESCGACAAFCPTGALDDKMVMNTPPPERLVTTTCAYCGVGCNFDLNVYDDRVVRVTSNPNAPVNGMHLCVKGRYGYDYIHHPDRLLKPRVRRYLLEGKAKSRKGAAWDWIETDWETALQLTAHRLREVRDTSGPDSIGILTSAKCTNEENYIMNKLARQVIGTHNIDHCARL